ncbi:hypothetical protein JCM5353_003382 [Sporobolomyces roseus]
MPSPSPAPSASSSSVTRPSPSLSPSITSLLNTNNNHELTPFNTQDYFNTPTTATSEEAVSPFSNLNAPSSSHSHSHSHLPPPAKRQRPSSSPSSEPSSLPTQMPPPSNTHPRSRPTSSSAHRPPPPPPPPNVPRRSSGESKLEPSVFNVEPIDEFTREVADWLWGFCSQLDWDKVEIEAKIGLLVDQRQGGQRVYLPVPTEAILTDDTGLRFQSNMSQSQHKSFNQLLNARVVETSHPSYSHSRIAYSHTHELDTFHQLPGPEKRKIRVTRDEKKKDQSTSSWKAVEKVRVADMNVYSPKRLFDWRVSISLENPVMEHPSTPPTHSRRKDRISYSHQLYTIDLTQVATPSQSQPPQEPTHELEIEFKDAKRLLGEAEKESRGEVNWYLQGVQGMLNNVRMLIRNASDP